MIEVNVMPPARQSALKLRKLQRRIANTRPAHKAISVWLARWVALNFKGQGSKVGGWAPLARGGRHRRLADGTTEWQPVPPGKILQDTGRLRASFEPFHSLRDAGIGSDVVYSKYHELGADGIPQRRMLPRSTDTEVINNITRIYNLYAQRNIRGA